MHNISLIIFTLLIQTSVGIFLTTLFNLWINKKEMLDISVIILSTCLGLIILGLISAMAHLGNPKNAPHAISNISHSWLSREIVIINAFAFSLVILWVFRFMGFQENFLIIEMASLISGILTIWAMSRVYLLKVVPVWNSIATPMDFCGTALLTGSVASAVLNGVISDVVYESSLPFLIFSCLGLCLKIAAIFTTILIQQKSKTLFWYASQQNKFKGLTLTHVFRAGLYISGVALFAAANMGLTDQPIIFLRISFCIIALTEIWNRFCFYDSFCRLGL